MVGNRKQGKAARTGACSVLAPWFRAYFRTVYLYYIYTNNWIEKLETPPKKQQVRVTRGRAFLQRILGQMYWHVSWVWPWKRGMLYSMKVRCDVLLKFQVPPHSELYGANAEANERRLSRPTDECFPRMPQSSDGFQARDERIYYGEWWTLCAWLFYAHACNAINYRCLKSKRMHRRGASAAKLRGNEWMQMEWRFKQPSFQSVDETQDNESPKDESADGT